MLSLHRHWYPNLYGQWGIRDILRLNNTQQPHLACLHIDYALTEDGLHPSEVVSAVRVMKQAMRLDKRGQFGIYPVRIHLLRLSRFKHRADTNTILLSQVYVYSFSNHKARILETYYDAGKFFVKKTPFIDLSEENRDSIKLYLRWMMNQPCGVTTCALENDPDNVSDSSSN